VDWTHAQAGGQDRIREAMSVGDYVLAIIVLIGVIYVLTTQVPTEPTITIEGPEFDLEEVMDCE
jgi:hypothetical protein